MQDRCKQTWLTAWPEPIWQNPTRRQRTVRTAKFVAASVFAENGDDFSAYLPCESAAMELAEKRRAVGLSRSLHS